MSIKTNLIPDSFIDTTNQLNEFTKSNLNLNIISSIEEFGSVTQQSYNRVDILYSGKIKKFVAFKSEYIAKVYYKFTEESILDYIEDLSDSGDDGYGIAILTEDDKVIPILRRDWDHPWFTLELDINNKSAKIKLNDDNFTFIKITLVEEI